jgi:hypothetical protein
MPVGKWGESVISKEFFAGASRSKPEKPPMVAIGLPRPFMQVVDFVSGKLL